MLVTRLALSKFLTSYLTAAIQDHAASASFSVATKSPKVLLKPQRQHSVTQSQALRSNAPGTVQPSVLSETHQSVTMEQDSMLPVHKRRNTLPSLVVGEDEARLLAVHIAQRDQARSLPNHAANEGVHHSNQGKRRSRSAGALMDLMAANTPKSADRLDRDAEIAFWRQSILTNPLPKFDIAEHKRPKLSTSDSSKETIVKGRSKSVQPAQSFDFGLINDPAAPTSLEQRINTLEVKLVDFEYALAKLRGVDLPQPQLGPRAAKRGSIHDLFPDQSEPSSMTSSTTEESLRSSAASSPAQFTENDGTFRSERASKATIKAVGGPRDYVGSHPSSESSVRLTSEQFDTLLGLIQDEKAARQQMKLQILDLQKEIEHLRAPVYASIRPRDYPTPSPESFHDATFGSRSKPLHRSPNFGYREVRPQQEMSRFSMTESEIESEVDDGFQEAYQTPKENRFTFETTRASPMVGMI